MGDDIRVYLTELADLELKERQRLDEVLPAVAVAAAPWLLRVFGPYFAKKGLQWGGKTFVRKFPKMLSTYAKRYPQTAAKLGLNNPEIRRMATRASIRLGLVTKKYGEATLWKSPRLAMLRAGGGLVAGHHAANALDDVTDFEDDPEAQKISQQIDTSSGEKGRKDSVRRMLTQHGFSDHLAGKFIKFLEKGNSFSGTQAMNAELAMMMAELQRSPKEYLEFAKTL